MSRANNAAARSRSIRWGCPSVRSRGSSSVAYCSSAWAGPHMPLSQVLATLRRLPSFWLISFGTAMGAFGYYGQASFFGSLYMRTHVAGIDAMAASWGVPPTVFLGLSLGLIVGLVGMVGTFVGGQLAD